MQAIILAAGMGKRLKELTKDNTKCMVEVNGTTLIERMLRQIDSHGLSRIVIVTGYKGQKLKDYISTLGIGTRIDYVCNEAYETTNNIRSLALAQEQLCEDDTLLFESDLIVDDGIIDLLVSDPRPSLALVDRYESWMDGTCVKLSSDDVIEEFVPGSKFRFEDAPYYYKTVNIYKFSRRFSAENYVPFLNAYIKAFGDNEYYEQVLRVVTNLGDSELKAMRLNGQKWYEIDDVQDLDIASSIFATDSKQRADLMSRRNGGYWRYPHMLDFTDPVFPDYPPQRMMDEFKANFEKLASQRPSGAVVLSLLAAKCFNVFPENVVVGNGASGLMSILLEDADGRTGLVSPGIAGDLFDIGDPVVFNTRYPDYRYTADDLMIFFADKGLRRLIIANPDCPSGNRIGKEDMMRLAGWCDDNGIRLIVDESMADLADDAGSMMDSVVLTGHRNLVLLRSVSGSEGIPGLRLGVLVSGDRGFIDAIKGRVPAWNVDSFAEFYLQIEEKYRKDYAASVASMREERERFRRELDSIDGFRAVPSATNFYMVEVTGGKSSGELASALLADHDILVKDLGLRIPGKDFIGVCIRGREDNDRLLSALRQAL